MKLLYKLGACLIVILLLHASAATADSSKEITTSDTDENPTLSLYSLLIKTSDKDKEKVLEYIDKCKLSAEKKAQLKDDLKDAWDRYPDKTTKDDYLLCEEVGTLITEYAQKTKIVNKEPVAEPLPPIKEPVPYERFGYLLKAKADSRKQTVLFGYIDNCYVSEKDKQEMKDSMKDIWSRYPDAITEQDNETLAYVENKTAEYLNNASSNNGVNYTVTTPDSAEQLAQYSHGDLEELYDYVYNNRDTFENMPEVASLTNELLRRTTKYNTGLVKYVRGKKGDCDDDGDVDFDDFVEFAEAYNSQGGNSNYNPIFDFDEDSDVDFDDFVEFAALYES